MASLEGCFAVVEAIHNVAKDSTPQNKIHDFQIWMRLQVQILAKGPPVLEQ